MKKLIVWMRGATLFLMIAVQTLLWMVAFVPVSLVKLLVPIAPVRRRMVAILHGIVVRWIGVNNRLFDGFLPTRWFISGVEHLNAKGWYLILPNHQSWVDIFAVVRALHRRVPVPKFFLKKELMWVPVMGFVWKMLDYPFMRRYSRETLEKKPHLKGKDLAETRKACRRFAELPATIINFVEGTRFTPQKKDKQESPYHHLLRPKAGGIAFVLQAMGSRLNRILDVTIVYPDGIPTFWAFLCGRVKRIVVEVRDLAVSTDLVGDYFQDEAFKRHFQEWLNGLWREKDGRIARILQDQGVASGHQAQGMVH